MMANRFLHLPLLSVTVAALLLSACRDATPRPGIPTPLPMMQNSAPAANPQAADPAATQASAPAMTQTDAPAAGDEAAPAAELTALDPQTLASKAALPAVVKIDPTTLGQQIESLPVAGIEDMPGTPFVEAGLPAHVRLVFGGKKPNTQRVNPRELQVLIIPIAGYLAKFDKMPELQEEVKAQIDELRKFLDERTITDAETITVLPPFNAAQLIHSRIEFLKLPNGRGVRFLTSYATDPAPITAADLFYTFQGFTDDGLYYISAFFPLDTTTLAKTPADVSAVETDEASNRFGDYLVRIAQQIQTGADSDFTPALGAIDAVVRSIEPLASAPGTVAQVAPPAVTLEPTVAPIPATTEPTVPVITQPTAAPVVEATVAEATATETTVAEATVAEAAQENIATATATKVPASATKTTATARPALQLGRTTAIVNLRSAAGTRARIIMEVARNTAVTVLGRNSNSSWLRVRLRSGRVGWMASAYVRGVNLRRLPITR